MLFGPNILPNAVDRYTLRNATLSNGILHLDAEGSATCQLTVGDIAVLPSNFRVSIYADTYANNYVPDILVTVSATFSDGSIHTSIVTPTLPTGNVFTTTVGMTAGAFVSATFTITSDKSVTITLWELCAEIADANDITTIIDGVEQSLPRILYDYNTSPISIGTLEHTIGLISLSLLGDTDLNGNLLLTYDAPQPCTLTLRFKDNDSTELFSPVVYTLSSGHGNIGIPHAYLKRRAGIHSMRVTAQVSTGTIAVPTRGMLFTVDGGYLAARVTDIGVDTRDIAIRQIQAGSGPDSIFLIGIENGQAVVRSKAYSASASVLFEPQFVVAPAKNAAIEFNGAWALNGSSATSRDEYLIITHDGGTSIVQLTTAYDQYYYDGTLTLTPSSGLYTSASQNVYTLLTDDYPFCFWIDDNDSLYVQYGTDVTTREQLDTSVSSISVCRGYKSTEYPELDQGLICLYIKSGAAYYRSYTYNDDRYIWSAATQITQVVGTVQQASVHRLNDFRIGFAITTDSENYWMISDRTYVGQSVLPERITAAVTQLYAAVAMRPSNATPAAITFTTSASTDNSILYVESSYPMRCLGDMATWLTLRSASAQIASVTLDGTLLTVKLDGPAVGSVALEIPDMVVWQYSVGGAWYAMPAQTFTWDIRHSQAAETIAVGTSSLTTTIDMRPLQTLQNNMDETMSFEVSAVLLDTMVQQLQTKYNNATETLSITTSSLTTTITVTQVGVIPV